MERLTLQLNRKKAMLFLGCIILFGLLIRLMFAYYKVHYFDLDYYVDWSQSVVNDGIFAAYQNLGRRLDYPPVFLFFLYPTGWLLNLPAVNDFGPYRMLALKMVQVAFDVAVIPMIYLVLRKQNRIIALMAAAVWAANPTAIFNSSVWGQTDSLMIFFLLLAFWLLEQDRPTIATVVYAIAGLTKFQSLYFAPVFLLFLFYRRGIKKPLLSFGAGVGTGVLIFLPFTFYSGIALPFQVYLGGLGKWTNITFNAYNIYAAVGLNNVIDSSEALPGIPYSVLGTGLTILAVVVVTVLFFLAPNKCPWTFAFLLMNSIFMFGGRMHERYQIPVLIFLLIAAVRNRSGKLFGGFLATTAITFSNHFLLFEHIVTHQTAAWSPAYGTLTVICSILNVILYFFTAFFGLTQLFPNLRLKQAASSAQPDLPNAE